MLIEEFYRGRGSGREKIYPVVGFDGLNSALYVGIRRGEVTAYNHESRFRAENKILHLEIPAKTVKPRRVGNSIRDGGKTIGWVFEGERVVEMIAKALDHLAANKGSDLESELCNARAILSSLT